MALQCYGCVHAWMCLTACARTDVREHSGLGSFPEVVVGDGLPWTGRSFVSSFFFWDPTSGGSTPSFSCNADVYGWFWDRRVFLAPALALAFRLGGVVPDPPLLHAFVVCGIGWMGDHAFVWERDGMAHAAGVWRGTSRKRDGGRDGSVPTHPT